MVSKVFNYISVALHPLFVTTLGMMLLIFRLMPGTIHTQWLLMAYCIGYTVILPLAFITLAKKIGFIGSLRKMERRERILSLIITGICVYSFSYVLKGWHTPVTMQSFAFGASVMIFISLILSTFSRISLHSIGWGGLTALVSYFSFSQPDLSWLLGLVVLLSGLVGTARIYLDEHTPRQIYLGYLIGFFTIWTTFIVRAL